MASNVRQNRTLEAYCCLRGLENEVTSDFCLAPFSILLLDTFPIKAFPQHLPIIHDHCKVDRALNSEVELGDFL